MANKLSFDESELKAVVESYRQYMEDTAGETTKFVEKVREIAERTKYEPIVIIGNKCINFYTDEVKTGVENQFDNWCESEGSIKAYIIKMKGGDAAEGTASTLQVNLREQLESMFPGIEEINVDTSNPVIDPANYDELKEATDLYKQEIENIMETATNELNNKIEENTVYSCIRGPIQTTLQTVITSFESIANQFETIKESYVDNQNQAVSTAESSANELKKAAEAKGQEIFDGISGDLVF